MSTSNPKHQRERYRGFETIAVPIVVRVGGVRVSFGELSQLAAGTVLRLDTRVGVPFDLLAAGEAIASVEPIASDGQDGIALKLVIASDTEDAGNAGATDSEEPIASEGSPLDDTP